jgi:pyruvate dehydrogenase E2 component (dihydrolipoamide acetyltransferase)
LASNSTVEEMVLMVTDVIMPRLGLLMKQGTIGKWLKKEGESVEKGEPLFEVEAEKITKKIEAPESGVLRRILVPEKATVPVLQRIAIIALPEEALPPDLDNAIQVVVPAAVAITNASLTANKVSGEAASGPRQRVIITPVARKIAEENKLDISRIKGTGPGGRVTREDVLKAVEEATKSAGAQVEPAARPGGGVEVKPMTYLRKMIAERMLQSQQGTAHVTLNMTVDMTEAARLRGTILEEVEKAHGVRISFNDMVARAVTRSLKDHPLLNSAVEGESVKIFSAVHLGVAVATEQGLMVPVIRDADRMSMVELASASKKLAEKVRAGAASIDEVTGSTFTVTNLGMFGVETFTPIINPPEAAILGVGAIGEAPAVVGGQIVVRMLMPLSLTVDHRIVDGDVGARFLQRVKQILENPHLLLI